MNYYAWGGTSEERYLALTLLVTWVFADYENVALAANHLALLADPLHARLDLHGFPLRRFLFVAVDNTAPGEVVRAQFHYYPVLRKDSNVVLTHLP